MAKRDRGHSVRPTRKHTSRQDSCAGGCVCVLGTGNHARAGDGLGWTVRPARGPAPRREVGVILAKFDRPAATDGCQCMKFWGKLEYVCLYGVCSMYSTEFYVCPSWDGKTGVWMEAQAGEGGVVLGGSWGSWAADLGGPSLDCPHLQS